MKVFFTFLAIVISTQLSAQSKEESTVLKLSNQIFNWEVTNSIDSLESLCDDKFAVVGSNGDRQSKSQYIARLKSGNFNHNSIDVEENTASVVDNTCVVVGKGKFTVTVSGVVKVLHLSYTEVFTRHNEKQSWKLLALHASAL